MSAATQIYYASFDAVFLKLPATERFGVVDAEEVQIDTLAARLRDEVVAANATILLPLLVGAWASKSGS